MSSNMAGGDGDEAAGPSTLTKRPRQTVQDADYKDDGYDGDSDRDGDKGNAETSDQMICRATSHTAFEPSHILLSGS